MSPTLIQKALEKVLGKQTHLYAMHHVGGGFINQTYKAVTSLGTYFIKLHETAGFSRMFDKEMSGLQLLRSGAGIDIANPVGTCEMAQHSFLVLEWIEPAPMSNDYWSALGKGLARIHKNTSRTFGLTEDNYFGSLVQYNSR